MNWMLIGVLQVIGTYIASIILHELGHYIYFRDFCKKEIDIYLVVAPAMILGINMPFHSISIKTGKPEDYEGLTAVQRYMISASGIIAGFAPILFMTLLFNWLLIFLLPAYIIGTQTDIKIMYNAFKEGKK